MANLLTSIDETVDMGIKYQMPLTIPADKIWKTMVDKIYSPEKYLPVNDVKTIDILADRHVYREMNFSGFVIKEDCYFDKANYKVRAEVIDDDVVHVNLYHPETGIMEYYQENRKGDRIPWPVPKTFVLAAMTQAKELAESLA